MKRGVVLLAALVGLSCGEEPAPLPRPPFSSGKPSDPPVGPKPTPPPNWSATDAGGMSSPSPDGGAAASSSDAGPMTSADAGGSVGDDPAMAVPDAAGGADTAAGNDAGAPRAAPPPSDPFAGVTPDQVRMLSQDHGFAEGVLWLPSLGKLLYADAYAGTGTHVGKRAFFHVTPPSTITPVDLPIPRSIGLALDPQGNIVAASGGKVMRVVGDVAEDAVKSAAGGATLPGTNDLVVLKDGTIFVSTPGQLRRIDPQGVLSTVDVGAANPNGVALSPDGKTLYLGNQQGAVVWAFPLAADGALGAGRMFATTGPTPDGMCLDESGTLLVGTTAGIEAYAPDGKKWGVLAVPALAMGNRITNCAFGGADGKTLYLMARTQAFWVTVPVRGS